MSIDVKVAIKSHGCETDALTSDKGHVRAFARLTQTGIAELFAKWVEAEMARPDADPADMMLAMARYHIQTQGSIMASFVSDGTNAHHLFRKLVDDEFPKIFALAKMHGAGERR